MAWIGRDLKDLRVPNANQAMGSRGPIGIKVPVLTSGNVSFRSIGAIRSGSLKDLKRH